MRKDILNRLLRAEQMAGNRRRQPRRSEPPRGDQDDTERLGQFLDLSDQMGAFDSLYAAIRTGEEELKNYLCTLSTDPEDRVDQIIRILGEAVLADRLDISPESDLPQNN